MTWEPLYAKPPYDHLEWTLTVHELSGGCPIQPGNCKIALFSFFGKGASSSSGMSYHLAYNWRMGVPYRFWIQLFATNPSAKTETWTGTVTDTSTGEVSEIGNWTSPEQKTPTPGLLHGQPVSFVEYWIMPKGGCTF